MAIKRDLTCIQGQDETYTLILTDEAGAAIDLTPDAVPYALFFMVKSKLTSSGYIGRATSQEGKIAIEGSGVQGKIVVTLDSRYTSLLQANAYYSIAYATLRNTVYGPTSLVDFNVVTDPGRDTIVSATNTDWASAVFGDMVFVSGSVYNDGFHRLFSRTAVTTTSVLAVEAALTSELNCATCKVGVYTGFTVAMHGSLLVTPTAMSFTE